MNFKAVIKEVANPKYGDFQFDSCMQLSRHLSSLLSTKVNPLEVAKKIAEKLQPIPLVDKVSKFTYKYLIY